MTILYNILFVNEHSRKWIQSNQKQSIQRLIDDNSVMACSQFELDTCCVYSGLADFIAKKRIAIVNTNASGWECVAAWMIHHCFAKNWLYFVNGT